MLSVTELQMIYCPNLTVTEFKKLQELIMLLQTIFMYLTKYWINVKEHGTIYLKNTISEAELNIDTLQLNEPMNLTEVTEQRLPMRKPLSMVQYWVDTGNLLHINCTNGPIYSDSGSSILEDGSCEPDQYIDIQSFATDLSGEEYITETLSNKNVKIVTSSNSSVDTAAYILANNNITKKAETIAIVEGSKVDTEIHCSDKPSQIVKISKNTEKFSLAEKNNHEKSKVASANLLQSFLFKSCVDKINKNSKNPNLDKISMKKINSKSKSQQNNMCSIFFSDSDESIANIQINEFQNIQNGNNYQNSDNVSKFVKRKKLYNRSDSPAEFTPVSEDNLSLQTSQTILRKCLPLRKSEHPALETPKRCQKFLFRARHRQTKFKRKLNHHHCDSLTSTSNEKNINKKLLESNENNVNSHSLYNSEIQKIRNYNIQTDSKENSITDNNLISQTSSGNHIHMKESYIQNSTNNITQFDLNQPDKIQKPFTPRINCHSNSNAFNKNKFQLKSCRIVIQRLPYKYYLSNLSKNKTKRKNLLDSVKSKNINIINKNLPNCALTSNSVLRYNATTLTENNSDIKSNKFITFNNTKTFRDILNCRKKAKKTLYNSFDYSSSNIHPTEKVLIDHSKMTCNRNSYNKKSKYVIANSSSDESDWIVPISSIETKSMSNSRNFYNKCSNITDEDSNQSSPDIQKKILQTIKINSNTDDVQHNKIKENILLHKAPARDCKNHKNKIKNTLITLSSSKEKMPKIEKNRAIDLAIENKPTIKFTSAISNGSKNTPNSIRNCQVLINRIRKTNDKSELIITNDRSINLRKTRNRKELHVDDKRFSSDNSGEAGTLSNFASDKKLPRQISEYFNIKKLENIQSKKLSPTKKIQNRDKSQNMQDSVKVKTITTQKTLTKKRKSFEIDLLSEEECIIPLKKRKNKN
ncbi:putative uncharacterized protein DDB_G0282133 isoform X2 [Phymastichus coffea]|uniref:putative uncharacterized protein DDB_G0282133 isoform X2 n=1 Tax=Phymastichus coffea TaxID=108790 RepID=UPI00273CBB68|nr:putative uncharacterized protein DDB_G0282133 isoform X2 [Phymastichus coffea]